MQADAGSQEAACYPRDPNFVLLFRPVSMQEGWLEWRNTMKSLALKVQRFLASEDGPTAVEYAVMLALIIIVCLTAITAVGTNTNATFGKVASSMATVSGGG